MDENRQEQRKGEGGARRVNFFLLFELGIEFAVLIALPLFGGVYLGKWLDAKYGAKIFVIFGILLALALSSFMIYRKIKDVMKYLK